MMKKKSAKETSILVVHHEKTRWGKKREIRDKLENRDDDVAPSALAAALTPFTSSDSLRLVRATEEGGGNSHGAMMDALDAHSASRRLCSLAGLAFRLL